MLIPGSGLQHNDSMMHVSQPSRSYKVSSVSFQNSRKSPILFSLACRSHPATVVSFLLSFFDHFFLKLDTGEYAQGSKSLIDQSFLFLAFLLQMDFSRQR